MKIFRPRALTLHSDTAARATGVPCDLRHTVKSRLQWRLMTITVIHLLIL